MKLQDKIEKLKDAHADEAHDTYLSESIEGERSETLFTLGRIKQNNHLVTALSAQTIQALEQFQKEKLHESLGFERFADFLDKSPFSPMSRNEYYRRRELLQQEGEDVYNLLTSMNFSVASRKLLTAGGASIEIDGDQIKIGGVPADLDDRPAIRSLIKDLAGEIRTAEQNLENKSADVKKVTDKLDRGQADFEKLRRDFDALSEQPPYARASGKFFEAVSALIAEIDKLPDAERSSIAKNELPFFDMQFRRIAEAFRVAGADADVSLVAAAGGRDALQTVVDGILYADGLDEIEA